MATARWLPRVTSVGARKIGSTSPELVGSRLPFRFGCPPLRYGRLALLFLRFAGGPADPRSLSGLRELRALAHGRVSRLPATAYLRR